MCVSLPLTDYKNQSPFYGLYKVDEVTVVYATRLFHSTFYCARCLLVI